MSDIRRPGLTIRETAVFSRIVDRLKADGSGVRESLIVARLEKVSQTLLKKYVQHIKLFDISSQERASIFSGNIGICENPNCGNYTTWKRPAYRRFCCATCAGIGTNTKRKKTCRARYGVDYISKVPEVQSKMSSALRKKHAAKGHAAPRKSKFEYVAPKVRPNTGSAFYVYVLLDPRKPGDFKFGRWKFNHEPFYVGKGKGNRAFSHTRQFDLDRQPNKHKKAKIRRIVEAGLEPIVQIKRRELLETEAFELEARLVHDIGHGKLGPLTNMMVGGGDGFAGYEHSKATKRILSKQSQQAWAEHSEADRAKRCLAISRAKGSLTLAEYRHRLKSLPSGQISVVATEDTFRMSHRLLHRCKCGNVWQVSPNHLLHVGVGCVKCRRQDPKLIEQRQQRAAETRAKRNLPKYLALLKSTYGNTIRLVEDSVVTFQMTAELLHRCDKGHEWRISPKRFSRYMNGCPYCKTHTTRTAKAVLLNVGHI